MSRASKVVLLLGAGALAREVGGVVGHWLYYRHTGKRPAYAFGVK